MTLSLDDEKAALRQALRARRRAISNQARDDAQRQVTARLMLQLPQLIASAQRRASIGTQSRPSMETAEATAPLDPRFRAEDKERRETAIRETDLHLGIYLAHASELSLDPLLADLYPVPAAGEEHQHQPSPSPRRWPESMPAAAQTSPEGHQTEPMEPGRPTAIDPERRFAATRGRGTVVCAPVLDPDGGPMRFHRLDPSALRVNAHGIREPSSTAPQCNPGIVLVPLLGVDLWGNRLGQGAGHYDRWLAGLAVRPILVGVAFDEQVIAAVPAAPHDVPIDFLVTPTRWIDCRASRQARR